MHFWKLPSKIYSNKETRFNEHFFANWIYSNLLLNLLFLETPASSKVVKVISDTDCWSSFHLNVERQFHLIGPLQDPVTWYKITYTGEQVAQWDLQNKGRYIVLEFPLPNFLTSLCIFVPCDRVLQRAYLLWFSTSFALQRYRRYWLTPLSSN